MSNSISRRTFLKLSLIHISYQLMISGGDVKAVQGATLVQAAPVEAEPAISVSALLELLKDADPSVKAQLRLALLT